MPHPARPAQTWRRSSYCADTTCVEVAWDAQDNVLMRDAKNPHGPALAFDAAAWQAFIRGVRNGELQ